MARRAADSSRYKFAVMVITAGTVVGIGVAPRVLERPLPKQGPVETSATKGGGGGELPFNTPVLLISHDGLLELYDEPGGRLRATLRDQGVIAQIVGARRWNGRIWYQLRLEDESAAWVLATDVAASHSPIFFNFTFCTGDAAAPNGTCGTSLPLSREGLWARWSYDGVQPNDQVQWLLSVNGEQYTEGARVWSGPSRGEVLVNLLKLEPRLESGLWTVRLYVNGQFITESSVTIH